MSPQILEKDQLFEFDENWAPVLKWDRHPAYQYGIQDLDGSKAVDVIGVYRDSIYFIEIRDLRRHDHTKDLSLWTEFELKVRNTVAGLVGAGRREQYAQDCAPLVRKLLKPCELKLVFWIEMPPAAGKLKVLKKRHEVAAGTAMKRVVEYVKWLDARVINVSREEDYERLVPGLKVRNLARRRRELAEAVENKLRSRKIDIGESDQHRISQELDLEVLEDWLDRAATISKVEELFGGRR